MKKITLSVLLMLMTVLSAFSQTTVIYTINADGKDATFNSQYTSQNMGSNGLYISCAWTTSGDFFILRSVMDFGLGAIPQNAVIQEAHLDLSFATYGWYFGEQYGNNQSHLYRITSPWDEDMVNWDNQPTLSLQNAVLLETSSNSSQNYHNIDVTAMVQDMVNDPANSHGFELTLDDENVYNVLTFASGDYSNSTLHPRLTITYVGCPTLNPTFSHAITGTMVQFTADDTNADSYSWDFGDGSGSTLQNPVHNYLTIGSYNVCLTITDTCGTVTNCDLVELCQSPTAGFTYTNNSLWVTFHDASVGADSWYWDFGDGNFSNLQNPVHYFLGSGSYTVCEIASKNDCGSDSICHIINLNNTGINQLDENSLQDVFYPNPCHDLINIQAANSGIHQLSVIQPDGKTVIAKTIEMVSAENYSLDISNLSVGVYYLMLANPKGRNVYHFVKQ